MSSPRNPRNTRKSEFYYKEISSVSTKRCACPVIEKAYGPVVDRSQTKQSFYSKHDPGFLSHQLGQRVWGWNPQDSTEITIVASATRTHTQTNAQQQVVLSFLAGMLFIHFTTSSHHCCVCLQQCPLIVLGKKPCPLQSEIPTAKTYWSNTKLNPKSNLHYHLCAQCRLSLMALLF